MNNKPHNIAKLPERCASSTQFGRYGSREKPVCDKIGVVFPNEGSLPVMLAGTLPEAYAQLGGFDRPVTIHGGRV